MRDALILSIVCLLVLLGSTIALAAVSGSPHDLSVTTGKDDTIYDQTEDEICVFCHTPHNAKTAVPLWNRPDSLTEFAVYKNSSTLDAETTNADTLSGTVSMMCLSCHDGTIALDNYGNFSSSNMFASTKVGDGLNDTILGALVSSDAIGSGGDLTNDHPINIAYVGPTVDNELADFAVLTTAKIDLFGTQKTVQCASCHDVHNYGDTDSPTKVPFLRVENQNSKLCLTCHVK